ncbi:hypothetical protein SBFV1_gp44 [Sulfolobales Beppu filamentous phage 1]|uniref:Uncharacterized protein n=1 Tax=Sulfolobales Beppu filamentous phage 1 TaxID=2493122 RepID=A0A3S8NET2_9VIRU|nr:hypothetical protein SBFV1_gp44 [Sulfolobales Beppu filamentous phage 1]
MSSTNAVYSALVKNSLSVSWQIITSTGSTISPQAIIFQINSRTEFIIVLTDDTFNSYTATQVVLLINGYKMLTIPINIVKQSYQTLAIALQVTVEAQPWEANLTQDILYALVGYLYNWTVTQWYLVINRPVLAHTTRTTTAVHTTYYCATSQVSSIGSGSANYSVATTTPSTVLSLSINYSQCQAIKPTTLIISDSLGNKNTTLISGIESTTCPYGKSCTATLIIHFNAF